MSSSPSNNETHLQNLLNAVTEAIFADERDLDRIVAEYAVPRGEVEVFANVIRRLHLTLVGVAPSRRFATRLKMDLLGISQRDVIQRVRFLPPRVQIAAGVAVLAGLMLLQRRRLRLSDDASEVSIAS